MTSLQTKFSLLLRLLVISLNEQKAIRVRPLGRSGSMKRLHTKKGGRLNDLAVSKRLISHHLLEDFDKIQVCCVARLTTQKHRNGGFLKNTFRVVECGSKRIEVSSGQ